MAKVKYFKMRNDFTFKNRWTREDTHLTLEIREDQHGGNMAIQAYDAEDGCPYATLTTNLAPLPPYYAYLDINNFPEGEYIVQKYRLGRQTGEYRTSGWCIYPLYKFYKTKITDKEG